MGARIDEPFARQLHNTSLYNHATASEGRVAVARAQHTRNTRSAADTAAAEPHGLADAPPALPRNTLQHAIAIAPLSGGGLSSDPSELRREFVVIVHCRLPFAKSRPLNAQMRKLRNSATALCEINRLKIRGS
jgi:hypothetical protein